ncbi:hypothetical protein AA103196_1978 [Ameyamaea chiangmaiensis NBRC 103196]|uniref:DUF1217 domain-containing protein n=1 Tax=Ameyamaea chiangmaiensis TaxID=442969 RepID=A0A850P5S2_9PROT|nr:DUF1217 domain-containing protein [Ameyamaea chiangmaiensis]MBS4073757.1 DUF1217 domain-containing protein [Ameyamaea chiangmaiensis]NVN39977.1 DUF1217 domain-containing protein [Ameyamaea chiangmaiensis]GBQ68566.1 hypothetical protein AA103196_1978 [Ameyamaea chiangmaiensis NBRC 103196]
MSGIGGISAVGQYLLDTKDEAASVETFTRTDTSDMSLVKTFQTTASSITSAKDLLDNYAAMKVVLGAYGLSSLSMQTAVLKQLMTQDPTSTKSLAQRSGNTAWQAFAKAFSDWSTPPFADSTAVQSIVTGYMTGQFEASEGKAVPGLGNALYFTRTISGVSTLAEVMSDPTLLKVVETVNGYDPTQFGALDYDQQVQMLKDKVNFDDFSTPAKIRTYAERYLATLQFNPQPETQTPSLLTLYGSDGSDSGILALFGAGSSSSSTSSPLLTLFG